MVNVVYQNKKCITWRKVSNENNTKKRNKGKNNKKINFGTFAFAKQKYQKYLHTHIHIVTILYKTLRPLRAELKNHGAKAAETETKHLLLCPKVSHPR